MFSGYDVYREKAEIYEVDTVTITLSDEVRDIDPVLFIKFVQNFLVNRVYYMVDRLVNGYGRGRGVWSRNKSKKRRR